MVEPRPCLRRAQAPRVRVGGHAGILPPVEANQLPTSAEPVRLPTDNAGTGFGGVLPRAIPKGQAAPVRDDAEAEGQGHRSQAADGRRERAEFSRHVRRGGRCRCRREDEPLSAFPSPPPGRLRREPRIVDVRVDGQSREARGGPNTAETFRTDHHAATAAVPVTHRPLRTRDACPRGCPRCARIPFAAATAAAATGIVPQRNRRCSSSHDCIMEQLLGSRERRQLVEMVNSGLLI